MASDTVYVVLAPIADHNAPNGVVGPRPVLYTTDYATALDEWTRRFHADDQFGAVVFQFNNGAPTCVSLCSHPLDAQFVGRTLTEWITIYGRDWAWDMLANVARVALLTDEEAADLNTFELSNAD